MKLAMVVASSSLLAGSPSVAMSREARFVDEQAAQSFAWLRSSESVGYGSTLSELESIAAECSRPNWDGHGAAAVTRAAVDAAANFLATLPLGTPRPSVGADPDGQVTLEWYAAPRQTLSVSVGADGFLHYAALLGASTRYGSEPFLGQTPAAILDLIREVTRR